MAQYVLVFNSGSSSFKFSLFSPQSEAPLLSGIAEKLGTDTAEILLKTQGEKHRQLLPNAAHEQAILFLVEQLENRGYPFSDVAVVGHRVVHGGEKFAESVVIDTHVIEDIRACSQLAPLHNPANLLGIEIIAKQFPRLTQVAVFDTAFHQSLPEKAYLYPIPLKLYQDLGIRRYGFHGTSHRYVSQVAIKQLGLPDDNQLLIAHLGNGCSATAVSQGKSVDTTMGLTPLEGLMMGTRSGDIDPSLHQYLQTRMQWPLEKITQVLNKESGLLGLSELSNDMRTLVEAADNHNGKAQLAIDVFCFRLARQLAGLAASLSRIDALVFTGGIGENSAPIRSQVLQNLKILGFECDHQRNSQHGKHSDGLITRDASTRALVINTNEEYMIALDALALTALNNPA